MQELAQRFERVADEVFPLQSGKDPLAKFFQQIAEQGHYAGRTKPSSTRQGIYAFAPSGAFLASINTRRPEHMVDMLEKAWAKWEELDEEQRRGEGLPARAARPEDRFPANGVIIEVHTRDLPRDTEYDGGAGRAWHRTAANRDQLWLQAAEAQSFIPERREVGAEVDLNGKVMKRIARLHFIDNVRGQTPANPFKAITGTSLKSRIAAIDGDRISLVLEGLVRVRVQGKWRIGGPNDDPTIDRERGMRGSLRGSAVWNSAEQRFESFALLAVVQRWGGTRYNARSADLQPNPMGIAMRLAAPGTEPVRPAFPWEYRW